MSVKNSSRFIGNLTRDAELKYSNSGLAICAMSIAVNEKVKRGENWEDEVSFFDLTFFGKRAESLAQYLTKGKAVAVECRAKQDRWEKDGKNHSRITFIIDDIQFLGSGQGNQNRDDDGQHYDGSSSQWAQRSGAQGQGGGRPAARPPVSESDAKARREGAGSAQAHDDFTDDIPF